MSILRILPPILINSSLIDKEYMTTLVSHPYVKAIEHLNINSIFSQG